VITAAGLPKVPGQPSMLNNAYLPAIAAMIESGPIPVVSWCRALATGRPLSMAFKEFSVTGAKQGKDMDVIGYDRRRGRPRSHVCGRRHEACTRQECGRRTAATPAKRSAPRQPR
jgi:hypothetical protein